MLSFFIALIDDEPSRILFEEIYLLHRQTMVYAANRILHDQMLAEDATHDAFLRILNHLDKISDAKCNKTRSFVVLIVRNIALDYYRRMKRQHETSYEAEEYALPDNQDNPEEKFFEYEAIETIQQAISKLHPSYTLVLTMKYSFGYSDIEIAKLLKTTNDKVRLQLHRARKQLRSRYIREGE